MAMWLVILGVAALLSGLCCWYLLLSFHRFPALRKLGERRRVLSWLLAALPLLALGLFRRINLVTLMVVLLHLGAAFLLVNLLGLLFRKLFGREIPYRFRGLAALLLAAVYLGFGWVNAHQVRETRWELANPKGGEPLRIVAIADAHLGITLDGEGFARQLQRVQAAEPDLVVILGDFVDDDSSREDMLAACRALGELDTRCGVFFIFGNHDEGYGLGRDFSAAELRAALAENGIHLLEDEYVPLGEDYLLLGRKDRSQRDRQEIGALTEGLDPSRFLIVLDHQPNDYDAEASAGADLVLSGHTHGGHMFPAHLIDRLFHINDRRYGMETRDGTVFLVSSGISGWAIPFKTGCFSEYALVEIR